MGLAVLAVSVVYEAANYPWKAVLAPDAEQTDSLPEPTLPADLPEQVEILKYEDLTGEAAVPDGADSPKMPGEDTIGAPVSPKSTQSAAAAVKPKKQYVLLGSFKLPKLGVSVNLFEGSDEQMRSGVGHVTGTALPGQEGNAVFSGHRSYIRMHPFRHLDLLKAGDKAIIHFNGHVFTYTAYETFFVGPSDTWVMRAIDGEKYAATLITCDPVIRPTRRMIVRMRLSEVDAMTPEAYFAQFATPTPEVSAQAEAGQTPPVTLPEETAPAQTPVNETQQPDAAESPAQSAAPDPEQLTQTPTDTGAPDTGAPDTGEEADIQNPGETAQ